MRRPPPVAMTMLLVLLVAAPGAAACDPTTAGPVLARGTSAAGVQWTQRAYTDRGWLHLFLNLAPPYEDWSMGLSVAPPSAQRPLLLIDWSVELGRDGQEAVVAGRASKTTRRVKVGLQDGRMLTIRPHRAPHRALRRDPALRRGRYFVSFYAPSATPAWARAYDASGRVTGRWGPFGRSSRAVAQAACDGL